MVKTKEQLLTSLQSVLGEQTNDNALTLLEDVTDTLNDLSTKATDTTDWKTKFEENDKNWREKYRNRFFGGTENDDDDKEDNDKKTPKTFDDLFSKGE